jgi:hypothetical protein
MAIHIITKGRVVWLVNMRVLDWTLDLLYTYRLQHLWLPFTLRRSRQFTQLQPIAYRYTHSLRSVCSLLYMHWVLLVCCPSSPRVPASHRGRCLSWIPELSPSRSHSNSWLTVHSTGTLSNWSSAQQLHQLELFLTVALFSNCSNWNSFQLELWPVTTSLALYLWQLTGAFHVFLTTLSSPRPSNS